LSLEISARWLRQRSTKLASAVTAGANQRLIASVDASEAEIHGTIQNPRSVAGLDRRSGFRKNALWQAVSPGSTFMVAV
jgi:hypothetical protein